MLNERVLQRLNGEERYYPHLLEQQFPRVLHRIIDLWDSPDIEHYFQELMVDSRGGARQGFPTAVASEIFALYNFYSSQHQHPEAHANVWETIPELKEHELRELGYTYSRESFASAVEAGNASAVKVFLSCGVDVDARDEREWTPLMISSFNGHEDMAALLVRCGARIQAQDRNGYTPLHWAAFNGFLSVVELLLAKGARIDAPSQFGWTALMQAATRGHAQVVATLLARGADPDNKTQDGWVALHKAAANGHSEVVLLLLEKGANRAIAYPDGSTALSLAEKNHHTQIVRILNSYRQLP